MNNIAELMTNREIHDYAARFEIAHLLKRGKTYREIAARLGVSHQLISKVKKILRERGEI